MIHKKLATLVLGLLSFSGVEAQDTVRYVGETLSNVDYHHGQLPLAVGVHNIQVMRARRGFPLPEDGYGWTYNHGPNLAHWNGTFYLHYLSDPVGEHIPPSRTLLVTSEDGYNWGDPQIIFPPYRIPDGTSKDGHPGEAKDLEAVMHQRMGFYVSKENRLLSFAYYGVVLDPKDDPNDGKGIGRVVREIKKDGSFGPIYFIRFNSTTDKQKAAYPFFTKSKDKGFVKACKEILDNPLMMQQWVEEADRDDPLIPLKNQYKAFNYYHLPDNRIVGLWKHALTSISKDGGYTWEYTPTRAPGFVNSSAKIWGQRTSDGQYATVYNPSEFRWPLALSTSKDGMVYTDLLLVNGEITSMRYGGNYKSYGPQYVRGILPGNGTPPDGNMWVTYSMNKEDIWVSSVPVPIKSTAEEHANEEFAGMPDGEELNLWNIYSPRWAPVGIEKAMDGSKALVLKDWDKFDYARAERLIPATKKMTAEFSLIPAQNDKGLLQVEFQDRQGSPAIRLIFDSDGIFKNKSGYRLSNMMEYEADKQYDVRVELDVDKRMYHVFVNGKKETTRIFFAPVQSIERIMFRTGEVRRFPDADTPTDQDYDLTGAADQDPKAEFYIKSLRTQDRNSAAASAD